MAETEKTRREKVVTVLEDVAVFIGVGTILLLPAVCLFYVLMGLSLVTMCAHWLAWPIIMDSLISRYNMPEWHTVFNWSVFGVLTLITLCAVDWNTKNCGGPALEFWLYSNVFGTFGLWLTATFYLTRYGCQ